MKQRLALLKLTGDEAVKFGTATLPKEFLESCGVPPDAKVGRRYQDVSSGKQSVTIVLEHASFSEVEPGAQIPEVTKQPIAAAPAKAPDSAAAKPVKSAKRIQ